MALLLFILSTIKDAENRRKWARKSRKVKHGFRTQLGFNTNINYGNTGSVKIIIFYNITNTLKVKFTFLWPNTKVCIQLQRRQ